MKILLVSGSRNRNGQCALAGNALLQGAEASGATTESIFLPELHIERCRQCNEDGWGLCAKEGRCIITEDDFYTVFEKIKEADAVIFATPVYLWEPSESFWALGTRMRRLCFKWGKTDTVSEKPVVLVAVAGGGGTGSIRTLFQVEQMMDFTGFKVVDLWPLQRQNLEGKLPQLELAGKWLVTRHNEKRESKQ